MATKLLVSNLQPWSAFTHTVWPCLTSPLTRAEVRQAIADNNLQGEPWEHNCPTDDPLYNRYLHIARVAYLVVNPTQDPIGVDVGIPSMGCPVAWPVVDGNHRLTAALFRRDTHIDAEVSGSITYAVYLLKCSEGEIG
jgi:hypothetical protein